uniref:Peptidase aspartic putative domain-containing protein n=1 Tax=Trichuris muris TaxID=70415 RepID=A0A5S6QVC6_TRIMR
MLVGSCLFHASSSNVSTVVKKMPKQLRDRWGSFVTQNIKPRFPKLRDLSDWITERREAADVVADESDNTPWRSIRSSYDKKKKPRVMVTAGPVDHTAPKCTLCSDEHLLPSCLKFIGMPPEQRAETVKRYRCLLTGHIERQCNTRVRCTEIGCQAAHHPMLHGAPRLFKKKQLTGIARCCQSQLFTSKVCQERTSECLLPIVPLMLITPDGRRYRIRALLDSGSEVSMIHMDVANALGLCRPKESCPFTTFHDQHPSLNIRRVSFRIVSIDGRFSQDIEDAYTVPKLQLPIQATDLNTVIRRFSFLHSVVVDTGDPQYVTLLIEMEYPAAHAAFESKSEWQDSRSPRAMLTPFGWSIVGPFSYKWNRTQPRHCFRLPINDSDDSLVTEQLLDKFFNSDLTCVPTNDDKAISPEEKCAWKILEESIRFDGERYQDRLLWKHDQSNLPVNRVAALRRFNHLERRLMAHTELGARYTTVMKEYISAGHARKLSPREFNVGQEGRTSWQPHHAVINLSKPSKLRIVFDAAAKFKGMTWTSALLKGPDLMANLVCILYDHLTALLYVFLWREPGSEEPIDDYEMTVKIFGATSSPAICAYVLRKAATDSDDRTGLVMSEVADHFYVDNWLSSFPSEGEAVHTAKMVKTAFKRTGFELTQWATSSAAVIEAVADERLTSVNTDLDSVLVERTVRVVA